MKHRILVACLSIGAVGCTSATSVMEKKIRPRAAFDLNCPSGEIDIAQLDGGVTDGTYGARGCGKLVRYETSCARVGTNCKIDADVAGTQK